MKLKNITDSDKELVNAFTGERIVVGAKKTIELDKAAYNPNAFKKIEVSNTEKKEQINNQKEVK